MNAIWSLASSIHGRNSMNTKVAFHTNFADVKGQESVKRALEVAASGGHNLIMIGSPGSGKSMMAKCMPSILPPLHWVKVWKRLKYIQ